MKKLNNFKSNIWYYMKALINGVIMVISDIIPGFSGGIALTITGMLKKVWGTWELIIHPKKKGDRSRAILFYVFFGIGALGGTVGFAQLVRLALFNYPSITFWFFLTFAFGSIFIYIKHNKKEMIAKDKKGVKKAIAIAILGMSVMIGIALIAYFTEGRLTPKTFKRGSDSVSFDNVGVLILVYFAGFLSAAAMVTPGMSGALVVVAFGVYSHVYSGLYSNIGDHPVIFPLYILATILGTAISALVLGKFYKKYTFALNWFFFGTICSSIIVMVFLFDVWIPDDPIRWVSICGSIALGSFLTYLLYKRI